MMYPPTEEAKRLFNSIQIDHGFCDMPITTVIEQLRKKWVDSGKAFLSIEEIDKVIEEYRNDNK